MYNAKAIKQIYDHSQSVAYGDYLRGLPAGASLRSAKPPRRSLRSPTPPNARFARPPLPTARSARHHHPHPHHS